MREAGEGAACVVGVTLGKGCLFVFLGGTCFFGLLFFWGVFKAQIILIFCCAFNLCQVFLFWGCLFV